MQGGSIKERMNAEAGVSVATEEMLEELATESDREGLCIYLRKNLIKPTNLLTTKPLL